MKTSTSSWQGCLPRACDDEPLRSPLKLFNYLRDLFVGGVKEEALWLLISMNPGRRPLARTLLGQGPMVTVSAIPRDVFQIALRHRAYSIAFARTATGGDVHLGNPNRRIIRQCGAAAEALDIELADYLVVRNGSGMTGPQFVSWRSADSRRRTFRRGRLSF